jgi:4-hydroxyphenylpyruvate dioxygenase
MDDFLPIMGIDHVEFYVGNAKQAAHYYRSAFGFAHTAYSGLETGVRGRASYVMEQGKIRLIMSAALGPDHAISRHANLHGDGVAVVALAVPDAARPPEQSRPPKMKMSTAFCVIRPSGHMAIR